MLIRPVFMCALGIAAIIPSMALAIEGVTCYGRRLLLLRQLLFAMQCAWRLFVYKRELLFAEGR